MDALPRRIQHIERLRRPADVLARFSARQRGPAAAALRGRQFGHPLHPALTDLPIGFWTSATLLDLAATSHLGGRGLRSRPARRAAQLLVVAGVVSAVPTALSGVLDVHALSKGKQRIAVVHALCNGSALALYLVSALERRRGGDGRAVWLAYAGAAAATFGGYLGGHLAFGEE